MTKSQRRQVWKRARGRCEYCQLPQAFTSLPHELDHIRAKKHHGASTLANVCLACAACNLYKGPNAAGYDPDTGALVPLFNPRRDKWSKHFAWRGPILIGKTTVGRTTIDVLKINEQERVAHRAILMKLGAFPAD
jgi:HNH endonuclease